MTFADVLRLALGSVTAHRLRSALTVLGIVIGIASVVLLTSLGEGTRQAILSEFSQFGTNLLVVTSGKIETHGLAGAVGGTTRPLTLADAEALRSVPGIEKVVPVVFGTARVSSGERGARHVRLRRDLRRAGGLALRGTSRALPPRDRSSTGRRPSPSSGRS